MRLCVYFSPSNPLPQQTQKKYYVNYITASSYVTMRLFLNTPQRTEPCPMSTKSMPPAVAMSLFFFSHTANAGAREAILGKLFSRVVII